jgi:hypothetical protein
MNLEWTRGIALWLALTAAGCVARPPTIAHVHLGHALTGVHVTPNREGYLTVAQRQAEQVRELAQQATTASDIGQLKQSLAAAVAASNSEENFGLKHALILAANHIAFAATAADASVNVQEAAPVFSHDIARIVERCELIGLLGNDVAGSTSRTEAGVLAQEILKLAQANVEGEDVDADGTFGNTPAEYGMRQLRSEFDAMIAREHPAYRTVDQWYLFNLVRLPNGRWVFDKLGRGGNIEGYK